MSQTEIDPVTANTPTPTGPHIKYLIRRETHSSRAVISVIVALLILAGLIYLITEAVMSMLGRDPLLMNPQAMVEHVVKLHEVDRFVIASIVITGIVLALIGLFLLAKAILPGTLRRHAVRDERAAIIVDDAVIAAGVSRSLRRHLRLDSGQVTTSVAHKRITANVTPTSGQPVSDTTVTQHTEALVRGWELQPNPKVVPNVNSDGVIGR